MMEVVGSVLLPGRQLIGDTRQRASRLPHGFLQHARAGEGKLRYFSSRWGYSPHITSYEIHNEIDNLGYGVCYHDENERTIIRNWIDAVTRYLKDYLKDPHLLTCSAIEKDLYIEDQIFNVDKIDFIDYSTYNDHKFRDNQVNYQDPLVKSRIQDFDKPLLLGEYGIIGNSKPWDIESCNDKKDINLT